MLTKITDDLYINLNDVRCVKRLTDGNIRVDFNNDYLIVQKEDGDIFMKKLREWLDEI